MEKLNMAGSTELSRKLKRKFVETPFFHPFYINNNNEKKKKKY